MTEHPPDAVTTGFDCKVNFLWRYSDNSPDANDRPRPEGKVEEIRCEKT